MIKFIIITALGLLSLASVQAQQTVLVNSGETITVTGGGLLYVSGDTRIDAGRINAMNLSTVEFHGSVSVITGGLYLYMDASGLIIGDLEIRQTATCWRYKPGVLTIEGTIRNSGTLNNEGEIVIGKP